MTILYEPVCSGTEHAPFNAALLTTALAAFPSDAVTFCSDAGHADAVRELLDDATVKAVRWHAIRVAPRTSRAPRARLLYDWRIVSDVLTLAAQSARPRIVACAATDAGLAALECQLLGRARAARVAVIHHSGLAAMLGSRSTQALLRWTAGGRLRHIVLGECIRQAVKRRLPVADVRSLPHPYLFPDVEPSPWPGDQPVRFAFLGLASADKGFDSFCRLANHVSKRIADAKTRPRFELIGRLDTASRAGLRTLDADAVVAIGSDRDPMPRQEYERRVRSLTYAVLPYRPTHAMASSGAILDAFAHAKPCVALRTPLFEEYFSEMGDIGYLCRDEDEMAAVLCRLAAGGADARYAEQRRNILGRRERFSPRHVAADLQAVLN